MIERIEIEIEKIDYFIFGIPGMFIPFILDIIPAIWLLVTIFIIFLVWSNCLISLLTS